VTLQNTRLYGPFHYEDLEDAPDDGYRREIIGGSLIVTPAPNLGHQRASVLLSALLLAAERSHTMVLAAPFDWRHPDGGLVEPDLLVIRQADADRKGPLGPAATPLLVVEILSPSNPQYDLAVKRALYERLGVPAYWIIDPERSTVLALRLTDGSYATEADLADDEEFVTDWPFPVRFFPRQLAL
jgi:Uma2 family endonuclease